jgi:hypothetical protein
MYIYIYIICSEYIYILYAVKFYPGRKKEEMLSFSGKWMKLKGIILSELNQDQKEK